MQCVFLFLYGKSIKMVLNRVERKNKSMQKEIDSVE